MLRNHCPATTQTFNNLPQTLTIQIWFKYSVLWLEARPLQITLVWVEKLTSFKTILPERAVKDPGSGLLPLFQY